ncbi:GXWXG protein-domain-containing protein [Roridomyces roridus]|uniref:GXWXG protein-domain-containing protein n=1 Tax=Roridomyces roridus TaxID=1738132 RepID=A0AAD7CAP6_9AGAR|nr:GXWXG protein-domain-containing protein [Roridomyces roridus]
MSSPGPEQAYLDIISSGGKTTEEAATAIFDQLKPVPPSFLIGEWVGADFDTGHPATQALVALKWAGKLFRSEEDVDPIIVYDEEGKRVWLESYGHARIREVKFRGVVSAAMAYDDKPIIDHFRYVNEDTMASMMDGKGVPEGYHFHLTRYKPAKM